MSPSSFRSLRLLSFLLVLMLNVVQPFLCSICPRENEISIQQQQKQEHNCRVSSSLLFVRQVKKDENLNHDDDYDNMINTRSSPSSVQGSSDDEDLGRRRYIPRLPQKRSKPKNQRPKKYWFNLNNVDKELRLLWESHSIIINSDEPPPIPNETLLNYWKRHDLRAAIRTHNGREELALKLNDAFIIPGRWKDAVQTTCVKKMIENQQQKVEGGDDSSAAFSPLLKSNAPPLSPQQIKQGKTRSGIEGGEQQKPQTSPKKKKRRGLPKKTGTTSSTNNTTRSRKPSGYWTNQQIIKEMYEYLNNRRLNVNLPSVYQPQLSELPSDLRNAMNRFGSKKIFNQAGLVPYHEWRYIEGFLDMLLLLKQYLDEYYDGNYTEFPKVYKIGDREENSHHPDYQRLHSMIQYYGGRKFLSSKLDMLTLRQRKHLGKLTSNDKSRQGIMYWGSFDLLFAIRLLSYVRNSYMNKHPPLSNPAIEMPTQRTLCLKSGEEGLYLHQKIQEYGGYENVARRLQLDLIQF